MQTTPAWRATALVLAVLAGPALLRAQDLPSPGGGWLAARLEAAGHARIRLASGWAAVESPRLHGDSVRFTRGTMSDRGGRPVPLRPPLALGDVLELRVPAGNRAGTGALWGGAIGAGLGFIVALAAASSGPCFACPTAEESFIAVPVLAAVGAGVGALVGLGTTRWRTVYRAP